MWVRGFWTGGCARTSRYTVGRSSSREYRRSPRWNNRATSMSVCTVVPARPRRAPRAAGGGVAVAGIATGLTPTSARFAARGRGGSFHRLLSTSFFARRDDFHAAQSEGRKMVAQCARTGRKTAQPRDGAEERMRRSLLTPRPGAGKRARLAPTAVRRGLLSFALRALRPRNPPQDSILPHMNAPLHRCAAF